MHDGEEHQRRDACLDQRQEHVAQQLELRCELRKHEADDDAQDQRDQHLHAELAVPGQLLRRSKRRGALETVAWVVMLFLSYAAQALISADSAERAIHHLRRQAQIVGGVGEAIDRGAIEVLRDFRHGGQRFGQRAALLVDGAAGVVHDVVRLLPTDVRRHAHHHGLGHDQALGDAEVVRHAGLVDDQPAERELGLMQRARGQDEALGNRDPFGMPRAGGALEVLHHRVDHQPGVLAHRLRRREHQLAGDRIALLRHRAAAPRPLTKGS